MKNNPIMLLHPVRKPLDQTARGALELLARIMLPMDTAERSQFWEGIAADIVAKGVQRGLSETVTSELVSEFWNSLLAGKQQGISRFGPCEATNPCQIPEQIQ